MKIPVILCCILFSISSVQGADKTEQAINKTLELYPAVEGKSGAKDCRDFRGRCMLFQTQEPVLELKDFTFVALPRTTPEEHDKIQLHINKELSLKLEKITATYCGVGKRLAIVYEGQILHAPKLRSKITTTVVEIDFCNQQIFKIFVACLRGEKSPGYDFTKACRSACEK